MTDYEHLSVDRLDLEGVSGQLGLVTLDRPDEMNPIDWETLTELSGAFDDMAADPDVRVVAITGAGRAFSAGGDMKKYQTLQRDKEQFPRFLDAIHHSLGRIAQYPKPFIALVNGTAVAGGFELILSCDMAFAAQSARLGDAHQPVGQIGGGGVLTLLPRLVGPSRARELIFSGRLLTPEEALDWGLVSRVVPDDELLAAGIQFATGVAKKSPLAIANAKRVMNTSFLDGTGVPAGLALEREVVNHYCLTSDDSYEGLISFAEKRRPAFKGS